MVTMAELQEAAKMIWNIIDRRTRPYRWRTVTAIMEPAYHDNSCADSDQAEDTIDDIIYEEREEISVADAVTWAHSLAFPATLYLYDLGQGINIVRGEETAHYVASAGR